MQTIMLKIASQLRDREQCAGSVCMSECALVSTQTTDSCPLTQPLTTESHTESSYTMHNTHNTTDYGCPWLPIQIHVYSVHRHDQACDCEHIGNKTGTCSWIHTYTWTPFYLMSFASVSLYFCYNWVAALYSTRVIIIRVADKGTLWVWKTCNIT